MIDDYKAYIKEHFIYNFDGSITRTDGKNSCGSYDKDGYLIIKVKTKRFKAHRIVWLLNYGEFPASELDHINRNRADNRIENLRESNRLQQAKNKEQKPNPDTGLIGVYLDKSTKGLKKKYAFHHNGKAYRFYTKEEAERVRKCLKN